MKTSTKWLLGILIGLVVIIGGVFIWKELKPKTTSETTATQISTAGWKTYTNNTYGYSIKYPVKWFLYDQDSKNVRVQPKEDCDQAIISAGSCPIPGPPDGALSIKITDIISGKTLDNAISDYEAKTPYNKTPIIIGGQPAFEVITQCESPGCDSPQWFTIKNNKLYHLDSNLGYDKTFDQIVSTFQFTTASTADWKTYTNNTYGFSFKYPKDWTLEETTGNNDEKSIVSVTSPTTAKAFANRSIASNEDFVIYYYDSVSKESDNVSNGFGATTLDELIARDTMIQKIGDITVGGLKGMDVIWGGASSYYTVLVVNNGHLYKIWFGNAMNKSEITDVENQILSTFQFNK